MSPISIVAVCALVVCATILQSLAVTRKDTDRARELSDSARNIFLFAILIAQVSSP